MKHLLEIDKNAEGNILAVMAPMNENGEVDVGYRIAGPKAWGGSVNLARLFVSDNDLVRYIKEYAPHLIDEFKD